MGRHTEPLRNLLAAVLISTAIACDAPNGKGEPSDQANSTETRDRRIQELMQGLPSERTVEERREALELLSKAIDEEPDDLAKRRMKARVEIGLQRYKAAAETTRRIVERTGSATDRLQHCLLLDRLGRDHSECYNRVVGQMESTKRTDTTNPNFLLALRLADEERFDHVITEVSDGNSERQPEELHQDIYNWLRATERSEIVRHLTSEDPSPALSK